MANDFVRVTVKGDGVAVDLCEEIMQQAAEDCRAALIDANLWAEVEIANDGYFEPV